MLKKQLKRRRSVNVTNQRQNLPFLGFPALGGGYLFYRDWQWLYVFPRSVAVVYFSRACKAGLLASAKVPDWCICYFDAMCLASWFWLNDNPTKIHFTLSLRLTLTL